MPQLIILGATPQRTYITTANSAATTSTYTFSGVSIGPASPDRYVVGCFYTSTAVGGRTRTAVSIGGSAATVVAESNTQITATNTGIATIAGQAIPSGTTADFSITYNNNMTGCILFVYILNNLASTTAFDTDAIVIDSLSVFTSKTVTLDIPGGGLVIAFAGYPNTGQPQAFTNVTEDAQVDNGDTSSVGSLQNQSASTGYSITSTKVLGAPGTNYSLAAASWS
jgi:hypothetical protein